MQAPDGIGQALLESSSDAIVATDREGRIVFWNPGARRIFGFSAEETLGQSLDLIIPENLRARHWEGFHQVMATGTSRYGDGQVYHLDGVSVEYPDWHLNVRKSNTEPLLRLNLEGTTRETMEQRRDEVLGIIRG